MGLLIYGGATEYEMSDRVLAHLEAVVVMKLRRHEYCTVSWPVDAAAGSGRVALSIQEGVPLQFHFRSADRVRLNPVWLQVLVEMANTPQGVVLVSEDDAERLHRGEEPSEPIA